MCGIAGSIGSSQTEEVRAMIQSLQHRGPDDQHFYDDRFVSFGVARLSIVDISGGRQPLSNETGDIWVAQNGEIYNSPRLRCELTSKGHQFRSRSDTEAIVHAYEEWGEAFVEHLQGMFAVIVWDRPRKKAILARDRIGIKPLYVWEKVNHLYFSSELRAFKKLTRFQPSLDPSAVHFYLTLQGIPAPYTIYRDVRALEPGEICVYELNADSSHISKTNRRRYWTVNERIAAKTRTGLTFDEAAKKAEQLLETTVESHLLSDTPVAAFLSGGIDSSTIAALMKRVHGAEITTLTVGWNASSDVMEDERAVARKVASKIGSRHEEIVISPKRALETFDPYLSSLDQPSFDGWNTFLVSQATAKHVKVALSGIGGDELFLGYSYAQSLLRLNQFESRISSFPSIVRNRLFRTLFHLSRSRSRRSMRDFLPLLLEERLERVGFSVFHQKEKEQFENPQHFSMCEPVSKWIGKTIEGDTLKQKLVSHGLNVYLQAPILRDIDVMSMAHSLEVRVPYLDHCWIEFVVSLPDGFIFDGKNQKRLLKEIGSKFLPPEVYGPKKGFVLPIGTWLKDKLRSRVQETLSRQKMKRRGLFDSDYIAKKMAAFFSGQGDWQPIWSFFVLESWMEQNDVSL